MPADYPLILGHENAALDLMADRFPDLPHGARRSPAGARPQGGIGGLARADPKTRDRHRRPLAAFNRDWRELDALIGAQFWRVAFHRVAEDEINYRRFFNINDLAGLRMELAPVFEQLTRACSGCSRRASRRPQDRSRRWASSTRRRISRRCASASQALLSRGREDPRTARTAARRLAGRGHDRLRLPESGAGVLVDPSAEDAFTETYRLCRRERRIRRTSPGSAS